jgi:hypothetical protein
MVSAVDITVCARVTSTTLEVSRKVRPGVIARFQDATEVESILADCLSTTSPKQSNRPNKYKIQMFVKINIEIQLRIFFITKCSLNFKSVSDLI